MNPTTSPAQKGFTLVETLVAITVLVVTIVGPLYAVHRSLVASYVARDKLIATALAQEGVEYIRSVRDNNYLAKATGADPNRGWLRGLDASPNCFSSTCLVDQGQQTITTCSGSGCTALRLSTANIYTHAGSFPLTKFKRTVQLATVPSSASVDAATEVTVTVIVSWETLRVPYNVTVTEHLYNWL